jgi:hypothetical protein
MEISILTTTQPKLTAVEAFAEIATRRICLTPAFDGRLWRAGVEVHGDSPHSRSRALRSVSAIATSPLCAIELLMAKLAPVDEEDELGW